MPRTAPVVALLGAVLLVLGLAGGATAAKLVTSKQIKNDTIRSVDVRNGALTGTDTKNGSLTGADTQDGSLTGADLAAGSVGADRLAPGVLNDLLVHEGATQDIGTCTDTGLEDCATLAGVDLTAGTWLVSATVSVKNKDTDPTALSDTCGLFSAAGSHPDARFPLAAVGEPGETQSLAIQDVVVLPAGTLTVSLRCTEMAGENVRVASPTLSAVRVR